MPKIVLFGSKPKTEDRFTLPMNGRDHFEYVLHDGRLFVKMPPCDQHDSEGRVHAYVQNPHATI